MLPAHTSPPMVEVSVQLPVRAHHHQREEAEPAHEVDHGQDVAARQPVGHPAQHQRAGDGDEADQADAHRAGERVEAVVHQHRHAVRAQQVHAEAAGEQAEEDLPEGRRAHGVAQRRLCGWRPSLAALRGELLGQQVGVLGRVVAHHEQGRRQREGRERRGEADQRGAPADMLDREG
jgi:hypothetical protein